MKTKLRILASNIAAQAIIGGVFWFGFGIIPYGAPLIVVAHAGLILLSERRKRHGTDEGNYHDTQDPTAGRGTNLAALAAQLSANPAFYSAYANTPASMTHYAGTSLPINPPNWGGGAGWGFSGASVSFAGQPAALATPPARKRFTGKAAESDAPVYGWRSYTMSEEGILHGALQEWPERELHAECMAPSAGLPPHVSEQYMKLSLPRDLFTAWLDWKKTQPNPGRDLCLSHLENDACSDKFGCGIWGRAQPQAAQVIAHCLAYGTVAEDEDHNWRASDARIEALYIFKPVWLEGASALLHKYMDFDRMAADLYARYTVPVRVIEDLDELLAPEALP